LKGISATGATAAIGALASAGFAMRVLSGFGARALFVGAFSMRVATEADGVTGAAIVATGGYAKLIAARMPEIAAVRSDLTLEGLRLVWNAHKAV
jgi:hypothetical protein